MLASLGTTWSCLTFIICLFFPLPSRSEQVCLENADLLHTHLALAGVRFSYHDFYRAFGFWLEVSCSVSIVQVLLQCLQLP